MTPGPVGCMGVVASRPQVHRRTTESQATCSVCSCVASYLLGSFFPQQIQSLLRRWWGLEELPAAGKQGPGPLWAHGGWQKALMWAPPDSTTKCMF